MASDKLSMSFVEAVEEIGRERLYGSDWFDHPDEAVVIEIMEGRGYIYDEDDDMFYPDV